MQRVTTWVLVLSPSLHVLGSSSGMAEAGVQCAGVQCSCRLLSDKRAFVTSENLSLRQLSCDDLPDVTVHNYKSFSLGPSYLLTHSAVFLKKAVLLLKDFSFLQFSQIPSSIPSSFIYGK